MVRTTASLLDEDEIPIIDLELKGLLTSPPKSWFLEKSKQINTAMATKGYLFLINHGLATERFQSVHQIMDQFCSLPEEVKKQYTVKPPDNVQGYVPPGSEQLYNKVKPEMKHAYNIQVLTEKIPEAEIPNFKEVVGGAAQEFLELSKLLLTLIAVSLELDPAKFLSFHKDMMNNVHNNLSTFRMLYYPPLGDELEANVTRCGEHCDWGTFTLLAQDSEGGLEVLEGGEWRRIGHLPGAILLNVADSLEMWTCKMYKSVKHRVIVPENTELQTRSRHSVAFFVLPDNSTPVDSSLVARCKNKAEGNESKTNGQAKHMNFLQYFQVKVTEAFKEAKL